MNFATTYQLSIIIFLLGALVVAILAYPGPKKSPR